MPTLSVLVEDEFVKNVDAVLRRTKLYSSRSEFIKDAVREKTLELMEKQQQLEEFRKGVKKLARLAKKRGYKGGFLTREQKIKVANEMLKEHGFPPHQGK